MNVMIVAAGLGSRVSNITFQVIPKFLINIDQFHGLHYILDYWKRYANHIYIVIHPIYAAITEYYIREFFPNLAFTLFLYEESDGTAFTIQNVLHSNQHKINGKNMLITWCDIFPHQDEMIDFHHLFNDVTIFTYGNECRYYFDVESREVINTGRTGGNIIGIYFFPNYEVILNIRIEKNRDIVEYLDQLPKVGHYPLSYIYDFGDETKLVQLRNMKYMLNPLQHRHFNEMTIQNGNIMKRAITEQGEKIFQNEMKWYSYLKDHTSFPQIRSLIPTIRALRPTYMIMEYLEEYTPLYKWMSQKENEEKYNQVIHQLFENVQRIHSIEKMEVWSGTFLNDLKIEIHDKIVQRMENIQPILSTLPTFLTVNETRILPFETILEKIKNILVEHYQEKKKWEYSFIHGDLNFSNILIHPTTLDLKFIDPRGYYGNSSLFGNPDYDYSKILYALYGYDTFNHNPSFQPFDVNVEQKSIQFRIPALPSLRVNTLHSFQKIHYAFMIIHWFGLAQYNKNNYWKCVCSYYHALYLGSIIFG